MFVFFAGLNNGGIERFGNHNYLFSWQSNDASVRSANWDWFNARNYCRKRCMDLVSIETQAEYEWLKQRIQGMYLFVYYLNQSTLKVKTQLEVPMRN